MVVIYLRVSTEKQGESGLGLQAQEEQCRKFAEQEGVEVGAVYQDIISGAANFDKCTGLIGAISSLNEKDILLVARRDRLSRDLAKTIVIEGMVKKAKARILSASNEGNGDSPEALFSRRLFDLISEYERAVIGQRIRGAIAIKKNQGKKYSRHAPYGHKYRYGKICKCESEQRIMKTINSLWDAGNGYSAIALYLNEHDVKTRTNKNFYPATVYSILNKEKPY